MHFGFVPVTLADMPLLLDWLSAPASQRWWGDPGEEIRLIYEGEASGESRGFIVHDDQLGPFAYIQSWPCDAQPAEAIVDEPWVAKQSAGTLGVDITIGRPDLLGKGLGSEVVRQFCQKLFAEGAPRLIIDPDAANLRAVRAYEKAGFVRFDTHVRDDGTTLLMEMFPPVACL
jgi:aminoglycoside 6'-N-acetyltransferase